jgi:hypothetical protein
LGFTKSFSLYFFLSGFLDLEDELNVEGGLFSTGGILVGAYWGVLVGDGIRVLVGYGTGVLVSDGVGVLVGGGGGVLVGEAEGVLVGEDDRDEFSSSIIVGLGGGESSTTSIFSWVFVSVFGMSNRTLLGFFPDEDDSINESFYAFVISCRAYSLAASHSGPRDRNLDLFIFVALVLVGWVFDQMLKAL